jgi:sortase A
MPLVEKQQQLKGSRRPGYAVFRKRRRMGGLALVLLLVLLALIGLGAYLFSDSPQQQTSQEPSEQQQQEEQQQKVSQEEQEEEEAAASEQQQEKEEEEPAPPPPPEDPTLFLTVPKLGLYNHTVRNDRSEWALDLGAIKLPSTGFPWEKEDTNTYIACHRIGWPGTESYNQCLNLPLMQKGDEVYLVDTTGRVYEYRVSEVFGITPMDVWVKEPIAGRDVVSLQTCTETPYDWWSMGTGLFGGGPESGRLVVRADRVS